ncbi:MAG: 50S ribosomal protein L15 [Planctomycetaceae bacterium]
MILDDIRGIRKNRKRKRLGRGPGSGHGKTAGRGHKGFFSRSGAKSRIGFEGGQTPLARRIAKRGFNNNQFAAKVAIVNVAALDENFENGDTVDVEALRAKGLAGGRYDFLKILGDGELSKKLVVRAHRFSRAAEEKITARGGSAETLVNG